MKLEYIFSYTGILENMVNIGQVDIGDRDVFPITGGKVWGPKLNGRLLPIGAEFGFGNAAGLRHLDVRTVIETDDKVPIYVYYDGILNLTPTVAELIGKNGGTAYGEAYWVINPRFETSHEKYKWLNDIVCVAEGRMISMGNPEYRVYQCIPTEHIEDAG